MSLGVTRSVGLQHERRERAAGAIVLFGIGGVLAVSNSLSILDAAESWETIVTGSGPSLLFALAVVAIGGWAVGSLSSEYVFRLASWCVAGTGAFLMFAFLALVFIRSQGGQLPTNAGVIGSTGAMGPRWFVGGSSLGAVIGAVLGIYDIRQVRARRRWQANKDRTDRLNERLRRSNQRLMVLNRVLRHNVRNDLNVAQGRAELIQKRNAPDSADARDAATIVDVTDRLVSQSDKARALEALIGDTGETKPIDLASVVRHELGVVRGEYPNVRIETDLPDAQPVEASPSLDTAVRNVVDNAARHNDATDPRVEVSISAAEGTATLTVSDNGPGIPDHEIDVIEADAETKLNHGSGLGLWLAAWIARESDGDLEIETGDHGGTRVSLSFPVAINPSSVSTHPEVDRRTASV